MATKFYKIGSQNLVVDAIASIGGNNLITLYWPASITASQYQTLQRDITAANYQVTTGKTLYMVAMQVMTAATFAAFTDIGYGDSAVNNSAAAPTNNKSFVASTVPMGGSSTQTTYVIPLWFGIPSTKYPYMKQAAANVPTFANFWCFEE